MTKKKFTSKNSLAKLFAVTFCVAPISLEASSLNWLARDLDTTHHVEDPSYGRDTGSRYFDDHVQESISLTQSVRTVLGAKRGNDGRQFVDALISSKPMKAQQWLSNMPKAHVMDDGAADAATQRVICELKKDERKIACNDSRRTEIDIASVNDAMRDVAYVKSVQEKVALQGRNELAINATKLNSEQTLAEKSRAISLIPGQEGLVTVAGGVIEFKVVGESRVIGIDPTLNLTDWSIFVRSTDMLSWDPASQSLKALKAGSTEVFVVTPGRISIISAIIKGAPSEKSLVTLPAKPTKTTGPAIQLPSSLASLDGLDYAVTHSAFAGNHSGISAQAPDLVVANEVIQLGQNGLSGAASFARAKSKVAFTSAALKVVDDRSNPGVVNYPLSGIRVKIAGTEFNEITNARGEVEVRDVPVGSRLLVELSDERGHIMPQVSEVFITRDASGSVQPSIITSRRFASIDLAARAVGVVQDMQKSSICGTVANARTPLSGYTVTLDVTASGPYYFNQLGYADPRSSTTGRDGQFCFFNVEPGPTTVAIRSSNSEQIFATALGVVAGRHQEERFNIADQRYIAGTMAAVATANEQLGSDMNRANRHDLVDSGEVYAIGSGEMMVPIEDGRVTTASPVLSFKGRVWTVSSSSDFETTIQSLSADSSGFGHVLKLVPNGFINDMAYFAHATHSPDLGSVVVEHGQLGGHGKSSVKVRLVDPFGRDVGDGWYFADFPAAKAVFFNVPPGLYSMLVETESGHWIAADTVLVYSESLSYVKTGNTVERRVVARTQAAVE